MKAIGNYIVIEELHETLTKTKGGLETKMGLSKADVGRKFSGPSKTLNDARNKSLATIKKINWADGFFRKDIGWRAIKGK